MRMQTRTWWRIAVISAYNWALWWFIIVLVCSQFLGIVWNTSTSYTKFFFGQDPRNPPAPIAGFNDELYSDRAFVCMAQGRGYSPMQLSEALDNTQLARVVDSSGGLTNGIRVVKRRSMALSETVLSDVYTRICDRLDAKLTVIQASCDALGFNTTRDTLHVVDGVASETTVAIARALPVLVVPFWDNAAHIGYVIPSEDGVSCVFLLEGSFQSASSTSDVLMGAPKSIRTVKTEEWLRKPGGQWRNGWYEDTDGQRWFANMMTSEAGNKYGIDARRFDLRTNREIDCSLKNPLPLCIPAPYAVSWGSQFTITTEFYDHNQVFISNSTRFGQFMFSSASKMSVTISYSLGTFISNISVIGILTRWLVSLLVMLRSYRRGLAPLQTTGIGCLSSSRTFNLLPIMLLPRLKNILVAFFTVGCFTEGQQGALGEAWFAMYPAIVELMFYYYSLLNIVAKIFHRRMSDSLFGLSLLFFCGLHYARLDVSDSQFFHTNGRVSTFMLSDEVDKLQVTSFFTTNAALRLNGYVTRLLALKLSVLALNLVPLMVSEKMTKTGTKSQAFAPCKVEEALAVRACFMGGLGLFEAYVSQTKSQRLTTTKARGAAEPTLTRVRVGHAVKMVAVASNAGQVQRFTHDHAMASYELNRLGYLVFGGKYLLSYDDWFVLTSMTPFRVVEKLWNYRISVFEVIQQADGVYTVSERPRICRLDDADLHAIPFYDISVSVFR